MPPPSPLRGPLPIPGPAPGTLPLLILGGGGHALVVAEAARLLGWQVAGFVDDNAAAPLGRSGEPDFAPRLGTMADAEREIAAGSPRGRAWTLGIGDLPFRDRILARLTTFDDRAATVVHPDATLSPTARLGRGVYVGPRAVVHSRAAVGDHAIVNSGAIVEHDCLIGRNAHVAPGSTIGGGTTVGEGTLMGIGCRCLPRSTVGRGSVVGCGAVVTRPIGDGVTAVGVPARPIQRLGR